MDSFNTQPPVGGWRPAQYCQGGVGCFNTQPPVGGWILFITLCPVAGCFNTQPPVGGWAACQRSNAFPCWFQHAAARRRLGRCAT